MSDAVLVVEALTKRYGDRQALNGVDLTLGAGELYVLLGPNGAGKTTLVHAICGRLEPNGGTALVMGQSPRDEPRSRKQIGLVPQRIALYPQLTVRENLAVLGRLAGLPRAEVDAAVSEALEWIGLADRADDRVDQLSGGMQRRVHLAAGVLHQPKLLLLDEPTVGVDPASRDRLHAMLRALQQRGIAILLTTHDMEQAEALATRVGVLHEGELLAEGTTSELVQHHFGQRRELTATLVQAPDASSQQQLQALGFQPTEQATVWTAAVEGGYDALGSLGQQLQDSNMATAEVRWREPGLREVFFRVTGTEWHG